MLRFSLAAVAAFLSLCASPAAAQSGSGYIAICNEAKDGPAFVAVSYPVGDGWAAEGWFEIVEDDCAGVEFGDGDEAPYEGVAYYFAFTRNLMWDGRYDVCVTTVPSSDFRIFASDWAECNGGFEHRGFEEFYVSAGMAEVALTPGR